MKLWQLFACSAVVLGLGSTVLTGCAASLTPEQMEEIRRQQAEEAQRERNREAADRVRERAGY